MITKKQWRKFLNELKYLVDNGCTVTIDGIMIYSSSFNMDELRLGVFDLSDKKNKKKIVFEHPVSFNDYTTIETMCKRIDLIFRYDDTLRVMEILSKMPR